MAGSGRTHTPVKLKAHGDSGGERWETRRPGPRTKASTRSKVKSIDADNYLQQHSNDV